MDITHKTKKPFWSRPKFIIWTIVIVLLLIIIAQNSESTSVDVLFWSLATLPKFVLILISMIVGALLTLAGFYHVKRSRSTYTPE